MIISKIRKGHFAFLVLLVLLFPPIAEPVKGLKRLNQNKDSDTSSRRPLRILFIGNSFTYFNNLPYILEQMAASLLPSRRMETKMVVEGGATLQDHWEKGDAQKVIREGGWDYVVLQEQSTLGDTYIVNGKSQISDPQYFHKYARWFDQEIKKSGAKPVFYLTWAREDASKREQAALNYGYMSIAGDLADVVAPVGIVWQTVRSEKPKLRLFIEDKSHPSGAGSYLAASVLYAALLGQSPAGAVRSISGNPIDDDGNIDSKKNVTLVDLSERDAAFIQRAAWRTYQRMKASGGYLRAPNPPAPELPKLPAGRKPTSKDLEGVWIGSLTFYPVPWPTKMELRMRSDDGKWKADLKISFEGHADSDKTPPITNFTVTETGISFLDSKGINGSPVKYQASLTGSSLSGIAEVKVEGKPIYAIGSWRLKRQATNSTPTQ